MAKKKKIYINKYGVKIPYEKIEKGYQLRDEVDAIRSDLRSKYIQNKYKQSYGETSVEQLKLMSPTAFQELNPTTFNPDVFKSQKAVDKKLRSLRHMKTKKYYADKNRTYKQNFRDSIKTVFKGHVADDFIEDFQRIVDRMSADEIAELRYKGELNDLEQRYINTEYQDEEDIMEYFFAEYGQLIELYKSKYNLK